MASDITLAIGDGTRCIDTATAQQIARDEAAGLRTELDARRTWGLRRRLHWALGHAR